LSNDIISRIPNRYRSKFSWLYKTALILALATAVLFMPAVIENFKDGPGKQISKFIKSMSINNTNKMEDVSDNENGQIQNRKFETVSKSIPVQTIENSNSIEVLEENVAITIKEKIPDKTLAVNIQDLTEENKFYIQVASFKDPDIAHDLLSELKQDYPAAYLFTQNDYFKVRIPDIKTSEQGHEMIKEIEMKLFAKPILVKRVQ
jgi:cell division septation protein DedD